MRIAGHDIGVCSWSLKAKDLADLFDKMGELELQHLQLALKPLVTMDQQQREEHISRIKDAGIIITSGMMGFPGESYSTIATIRETGGFAPDAEWQQRREAMLAAGQIAQTMQLDKLTVHIGFVPPSSHESYRTMLQRVGELAKALGDMGVELGMETGQETASELLQFINDLNGQRVFVNFDPANMILYGAGDPIEAMRILGRHIRHVHVKDATLSDQPGVKWGVEVPFGTGQVGAVPFLKTLKEVGYTGPLVIEREGGTNRVGDVRTAIESLRKAAGESA